MARFGSLFWSRHLFQRESQEKISGIAQVKRESREDQDQEGRENVGLTPEKISLIGRHVSVTEWIIVLLTWHHLRYPIFSPKRERGRSMLRTDSTCEGYLIEEEADTLKALCETKARK